MMISMELLVWMAFLVVVVKKEKGESKQTQHHNRHHQPCWMKIPPFFFSLRFSRCLFSAAIPLVYNNTNNNNNNTTTMPQHMPFAQLRPPFTPHKSSLPGRPGSLTPDQDAKLRELWGLLFRTFGILEDGADDSTSLSTSTTTTTTTDILDPSSSDKYGMSKSFKLLLANMPPDQLRQAFWDMVKGDNPDALLLRFLRARKWNVNKAFVMLGSTIYWRIAQVHVDRILALSDADKANHLLATQYKIGKCIIRGRDRLHRPIVVIPVRKHKVSDETVMNHYTIQIIETVRLFLSDDVDQATVLFDMTGFSMANMDYGPLKFMIKCFEAHYPESLGICLIHNSPWIFKGVWKLINGWLDPVVANKIHFTSKLKDLEPFISKDQIPAQLGGSDPYHYSYIPPDPNQDYRLDDQNARLQIQAARNDIIDKIEAQTRNYIYNNNNNTSSRLDLFTQLRKSYVRLDPYVRARSVFDRIYNTNDIDNSHLSFPPPPPTTTGGFFISKRRQSTEIDFQQDSIVIHARESFESFYSAKTSFSLDFL